MFSSSKFSNRHAPTATPASEPLIICTRSSIMSSWHSDGGRLDRSASLVMLLEHHCTHRCHPFGCVLLSQPCVQTEFLHPSLSCRECRHIFALMWRRQSAYIFQGCLQKPCFHLANEIFFIFWAIDFISQIRYSSSCLPILQHINHQCYPPAKGWHCIRSSLSPFTISEQPLRFTQSHVQLFFGIVCFRVPKCCECWPSIVHCLLCKLHLIS